MRRYETLAIADGDGLDLEYDVLAATMIALGLAGRRRPRI